MRNSMKIVGALMFFLNMLAFFLMMVIFGKHSLDFFWGHTGHFVFIGLILIGDALMSAIIFILPQNWSRDD